MAKTKSGESPSQPEPVPAPSASHNMVLRRKVERRVGERLKVRNGGGANFKRKGKKVSVKVDKNKPKKPPTAFFYYLEDFRKGYQEQNPDVKSMRDVGKACGEKWKTMSYEEKVKYYDIATAKRAEFEKALADYNKRMENGEFEDHDSETESDLECRPAKEAQTNTV